MKARILILLLVVSTICKAQNLKYAITNTVSGGMQAGIIAFINNPKPKCFLNAFWKGCIGGSLNYAGKRLIEQSAMNNNFNLIWPARIVNSLGSSMVYNGSLNKGLLSSFTMNLYFLNMQFDGSFKFRIDPYTLGSAAILSLNRNNYFEAIKSLQTGSIVFCKKKDISGNGDLGQNFGNSMVYKIFPQYKYDFYGNSTMVNNSSIQIVCHELIHGMQYEQFRSFDLITTHKIKLLHNINRYVVLSPGFGLLYLGANLKGCYNNFFENEADYFGNSNLINSAMRHILFRPNPDSRKWN